MAHVTEPPVEGRPTGGGVRAAVWWLHMALPILGLWLLLARPVLDVRWQHHPAHFWLVISVAAVNLVLALRMQGAARARHDARLLIVGYAFTLAAGFLFLHALATPGILVEGSNGGFDVATPVGLALASIPFALSSIEFGRETADRIVRNEAKVRSVILGTMVLWAAASLGQIPPLGDPLPEQARGPLLWAAMGAVVVYGIAAVRYFLHHRRRPAVMLVAIITAATLLAEAMVVVTLAPNWHLSWWEWHLLMTAGFGFVAYSAYVQYRREGSAAGLFNAIASRETMSRVRAEYGTALESLTAALHRAESEALTDEEVELITAGLAARFDLTERQIEVLGRSARALAHERDQVRRLGALARAGSEARVGLDEHELLVRIVELVGGSFGRDSVRIGLHRDGSLEYPPQLSTASWDGAGDHRSYRLQVRGRQAGVMEFTRPKGTFGEQDLALMETLAGEVAIALENVRLYSQLESLFRQYMSPDVADTLIADPGQAALGGAVIEVSALFADLRGFTTFSERSSPEGIVEMLNRYFGLAVPIVLANGGTVIQFQGDALLAVFNAPTRQDEHALRAARTGLAMQAAVERTAADNPGWPRFRIGINTGPALVGNIGSHEMRSFNVMGDAINVAARLEAMAEPGTVVIGPTTREALGDRAQTAALGALTLKGRAEQVDAYLLVALND